MKYLLVWIMPLIIAGECCDSKSKTASVVQTNEPAKDSLPACVQKLIASGNKEIPEAPLQVDEYIYQNKRTFLFIAQCCDQYNVLYDDSCKIICAPSGGFTGRGDGKCTDFEKTAKHIKLIWKDPAK